MKNGKHFLETVKWGIIPVVNYRGVEVWKLKTGYKVLGRVVKSANDVDEVLDGAIKSLEESLQKSNPQQ